jgi:hypothetical protein
LQAKLFGQGVELTGTQAPAPLQVFWLSPASKQLVGQVMTEFG